MLKKGSWPQCVMAGLLLGLTPIVHADGADAVLACMRANVPQALQVQDIELSFTDQGKQAQTLRGRIAATSATTAAGERLLRWTLQIRAPASYAGASYLIRESADDSEPGMYVYMPAVRRVRHVTGNFADGGLLGIDFSYRDFKQLQNAFSGEVLTLQGTQRIEQRDTHRLSFSPRAGDDAPYTRVQVWVDQKTCVPLKVQFARGEQVIKELDAPAASLRQAGTRWYAAEMQMRNLQTGTHSELKLGTVKTPDTLSDSVFDPQRFHLASGF